MLFLGACIFALTACGDSEPPHTHNYETLKFDNENHWYECDCGDKTSIENHKGGTATCTDLAVCSVCSESYGELKEHNYATLKNNETAHWYECSCGDKDGIEAHKGGTATCTELAKCSVCNESYGELNEHNYATLKNNETAHWYECSCGDKDGIEAHKGGTATCTELAVCSVCNESYGELKEHNYNTLKNNVTQHWYECVCGDKDSIENHNSGAEATETTHQKCTVCDYIITPALGHVHTLHLTKVDAKPQSCTKEGNIEYYTCNCGKWFTDNTATTEITDKSSVTIEKNVHNHATLKNSATEHWYECVCGDKDNIENHSGGTATCSELAKCSVCNVEYGGYAPHPYESKWNYNETHHWHKSTCDCKVKVNLGEHTPDDSGWCSACDQAILPTNGIYYGVSADGTYAEVITYLGTSTKVNIASTYNGVPVTSIYSYVFENTAITTVIIPDSITSIGDYAFSGCSSLMNITIPDSVTSIGDRAFYNCSSLTSATIGDGVTSIGGSAFSDCSSLTSITIPNSVTSIGESAFYNCSNLTSATIGDGVTSIVYAAFAHCSNLTSIVIPDSVTTIGEDAFYGCPITKATIPTLAIPYIKNSSLKEVVITSGDSIADSAFYDCNNLMSIVIPDSVTTIGEVAFYNCSSLTSITIPDSVTSIGEGAFSECGSLTRVDISDVAAWYNISFGSAKSNPLYYARNLYLNNELVKELEIPDGVTTIGDRAFYNCSSLTSVTIGDSVTSIGNMAFYGCNSLTSITIPDSVTSIGAAAFGYCRSLTSITIPDGVTSIGNFAFIVCGSLTSITIPDSVTSIGYNTFTYCSTLTSVVIGDGVTSIGNMAFYGCNSLTSITIPDSVTSIGQGAFSNCSSLTSITIPDSVTTIGEDAFYGCPITIATIPTLAIPYIKNSSLKEVVITSGDSIADSAFSNYSSLTSVVIGDSVTTIGEKAFYNCSSLTSIVIPDSVTSIGEAAFSGCSSLTSATIGDGVTSIRYATFHYCSSLTSIVIPDSVTSIGQWAFYKCSNLTSITIPDSVTTIGEDAFYGCPITIATIPTLAIPYIKNSSLKEVVITSGDSIADSAFSNYSSLTSVVIGDSVTTIGEKAFYNCSSLTSIVIPDSVTSIGGSAFRYCSSLTVITIPDSVTGFGDCAFLNCPITKAIIPTSALSFIEMSNLKEVVITSGKFFAAYAFENCSSLTSVVIGDSVKSISYGAFYNCSNLTSVIIGNSVTSIGNYAFSSCGNLTSVYYKGTASDWEKISIGSVNTNMTNATRYYYSESQPTASGNYWHYDENGNVVVW